MNWFKELAAKIAENNPEYLVEKSKKIPWKFDTATKSPVYEHPMFKWGDKNVDPFSFLYVTASRASSLQSAERVFKEITNVFDLTTDLNFETSENFVFPIPSGMKLLFHGGTGNLKPELLWNFFRSIVINPEDIDGNQFEEILSIKNVGVAKLTQAMFLANPTCFFPIDKHSQNPLFNLFSGINTKSGLSLEDYSSGLDEVRSKFPNCQFYEINFLVYLLSSGNISMQSPRFFQLSTNVHGDGKDYWEECRDNHYVYVGGLGSKRPYKVSEPNPGDIVLVRIGQHETKGIGVVYKNDYETEFDPMHRMHVIWVNKQVSRTSEQMPQTGFSQAHKVEAMYRSLPDYKPTFDLLDRLSGPKPPPRSYPLNQILFGPPGTGKTWSAEKLAVDIVDSVPPLEAQEDFRSRYEELVLDTKQIALVTFHQNFAYEDFVEGIRPELRESTVPRYELREGIFKRISRAAIEDPNRPYVLIIDEINRGNIAKIFGELITLIEEPRRIGNPHATGSTLSYSQDWFGVPNNLYIIGTMNTADRSIQLLDTALRRRFNFVELLPDYEHKSINVDCNGVDCSKMLRVINERIQALLDREHQIGHTYLFDISTIEELAETFKHRIFPLLQEYFFNDWSKIRTVLGSNGFVVHSNVQGLDIDSRYEDDSQVVYERIPIDSDLWTDPDQYRKIYRGRGK